jgi:hypothetical protein
MNNGVRDWVPSVSILITIVCAPVPGQAGRPDPSRDPVARPISDLLSAPAGPSDPDEPRPPRQAAALPDDRASLRTAGASLRLERASLFGLQRWPEL